MMKKLLSSLLALSLLLGLACPGAQAEESFFARLFGLEWTFSSGVGGWSTNLRILADGTFSGEYHDSEMGETGEGYPDGTVYFCSFTGQLTLLETPDSSAMRLRVDSLLPEEGRTETIEDGIRYVPAEPYGLKAGDEMLLYAPGTKLSEIPEDLLMWTHAQEAETPPDTLEGWFLCSEACQSGFVGYENDAYTGLANPWQDMTKEELEAASGVAFAVPEGAESVLYRFLPAENLAEMQFTLEGDEYCARIQPVAPENGHLVNISGMYYPFDPEEPVKVGRCEGMLGIAQTGSSDWAEVCLWYDAAPGLAYSLSVFTHDPDGLDLTAVAESVYLPMQGND